RQSNDLTSCFHCCGSPSWLKRRRSSPRLRIDRLAIVVCVENDRMRRARNLPLTVNGRWRVDRFTFEQLWIQSAPLHHLADEFSVAADVLSIGSNVRKRKETRELLEDLSLMRAAIIADRRLRRG